MRHTLSWISFASVLLVAGCGTNDNVCTDAGGVSVCGEFGQAAWVANTGAGVEWPPVAIQKGTLVLARGAELVKVDASGKLQSGAKLQGTATAPSSDGQGGLYVAGGEGQTAVGAYDEDLSGGARWTQTLSGSPDGVPPAVGDKSVHVATSKGLTTLDRSTGKVVTARPDTSAAAVMADGSLRYLQHANGHDGGNRWWVSDGPMVYSRLVAEKADGSIAWKLDNANGFVDFAPGPGGETYVVTGTDHQLQRVSPAGKIEWSFTAPCQNCTVAAAPTVSADVVYFPVWEERSQELIDPLYALDAKTGAKTWQYDGFFNRSHSYSPFNFAKPVNTTSTQHHPAGRPVVANDGTLYVSTDGAVSALDKNGQVLGVAIYDMRAGETTSDDGSGRRNIVPGVRPTPVLADDGTLYVYDGVGSIRAFRTGKPAAKSVWTAPFGGTANASRVQ
jgi:hypothetical protein